MKKDRIDLMLNSLFITFAAIAVALTVWLMLVLASGGILFETVQTVAKDSAVKVSTNENAIIATFAPENAAYFVQYAIGDVISKANKANKGE